MPRLIPTPGEAPCRLAIIGEAPGEEEAKIGAPFVGASGQELTRMLREAGIARGQCYLSNVFWDRPPENKLDAWCVSKREADAQWTAAGFPGRYPHPDFAGKGKYLRVDKLFEIERLRKELSELRPNLVLALGNSAAWALLGRSGIGAIRGAVAESTLIPGLKVLPTYHPAGVLRNWAWRPIVIADMLKAAREREFPEIRRPKRQVWIAETLEDLTTFESHLTPMMDCDIETAGRTVTCIGFAPSPLLSLVVPLVNRARPDFSHWSCSDEIQVHHWLRKVFARGSFGYQNGAYDVQWIWRELGIAPRGWCADTMLQHHALQPELQKGLGFLGSVYTSEAAWKLMHRRRGDEPIKREE